jgi:hypothetical protein
MAGSPKDLTRPTYATRRSYLTSRPQRPRELGIRALIAHCYVGLARLYRRIGKRTESDEHFANADDDVPREGDDVLAGEGGGGALMELR